MKRTTIITCLALAVSMQSFSQDIISTQDGKKIPAKVIEVTTDAIKYKQYDHQSGPSISIPIEDAVMIRFENGSLQTFAEEDEERESKSSGMADMGKQDAKDNYENYRAAGTGTFLTTFLISPVIGLAPAIATAGTPPSDDNLNYPSENLMKNKEYRRAYKKQAKSIKSKKVWNNYLWGAVSYVAALTLIIAVASAE